MNVFNAGRLGKLPIWLIQGKAYSYYLVVTVRNGVQLEIGLRSDSRALTGEKEKRVARVDASTKSYRDMRRR